MLFFYKCIVHRCLFLLADFDIMIVLCHRDVIHLSVYFYVQCPEVIKFLSFSGHLKMQLGHRKVREFWFS